MPIWAYCSICIRPLDEASDVAALCCGHTFHQACLLQWFRSSPRLTCPQCRTQLGNSQDTIKKLFFDVREQEGPTLNEELIQKEVERLNALIILKEEKQRRWYDQACATHDQLQKRNGRIEDLRKRFNDLKTLCAAQQEKLRLQEQQQLEKKSAMEEARALTKKVKAMENLQRLLQYKRADMETSIRDMGSETDSLEQLAVYYVSVMTEHYRLMEAQKQAVELTGSLKRAAHDSNYRAQKAMRELQRTQEVLNSTKKELSALNSKFSADQMELQNSHREIGASRRNWITSRRPAPQQLSGVGPHLTSLLTLVFSLQSSAPLVTGHNMDLEFTFGI